MRDVINTIITFFILSFVFFFIVKVSNRAEAMVVSEVELAGKTTNDNLEEIVGILKENENYASQ